MLLVKTLCTFNYGWKEGDFANQKKKLWMEGNFVIVISWVFKSKKVLRRYDDYLRQILHLLATWDVLSLNLII